MTKKTGFQAPPYASGTATPRRAAFARIQESLHPFIEGCSVQLNVSGLRPSSRGYGIPHHSQGWCSPGSGTLYNLGKNPCPLGQGECQLERTVDDIRPSYRFDVSCQGTVPEAIIAFLDSHDYEDAIRKAISLGGDSDTLACITGAIAQAYS